ncbi:MAG: sarcosine oxidase subunit delta [Alphaproteobacteria bacterium]
MLLLTCPVCGQTADETEFHPGGEAHLARPATADPENVSPGAMRDYLYIRKNPRGTAAELWQCTRGCGKWFNAKRDTVTQTFSTFYPIDVSPPAKAMSKPVATPPTKAKASAKPAGKPASKPVGKPVGKSDKRKKSGGVKKS